MQEAGPEYIDAYIVYHQNTIAKYIATSPILDMFMSEEWRLGERVPNQWW